jgi:Bax protein|tara:strand:+ start:424 stop:1911 length:1488 start_codon:yes stop_codon:yes gene_type:complete
MKKNLSYREKLLELGTIYKVAEIKTYAKNKKYLTTPQLELILKKNKVPIPTEINKSLLEIQVKKISKPVYSTGNKINEFFSNIIKNIAGFFSLLQKSIVNLLLGIFNAIKNVLSFISKGTVNSLNWIYNFKSQDKRGYKIVTAGLSLSFLVLTVIAGFSVYDVIKETSLDRQFVEKKLENVEVKEKAKPKKTKEAKVTPKQKTKEQKKEIAKIPEKKQKTKNKKSDEVREFVLPNLNLKTETVLSLFNDVQYDLKKVRYEKTVRPIYFTQFPKDLDEILDTKLKKDTFIKIVLPLVVAENQKILNDRKKFKKITRKKDAARSKKEKLWLDTKLKEYKVKKKDITELNKRMDIIPISIALAQAAKESGWGTSRFALEGNAIFGQWTWTGTGIAPLDRSKEQNHRILRFPILRASVKAYKNNLNTHKGYKSFREKRFSLRSKNKLISGPKLIHTLDNYAETGKEYTKTLGKIIDQNSLTDFENVKLANSVVKKELDL